MGRVLGYWGLEPLFSHTDFCARVLSLSHGEARGDVKRLLSAMSLRPGHKGAALGAAACWGNNASIEDGRPAVISLSTSGVHGHSDIRIELDRSQLKLSRDAFGRAALYWTRREETIWFASHLELLISILKLEDISAEALYGYGCFSFIPAPLSPIEDVFSVDAGCERTWSVEKDESGPTLCPTFSRLNEWIEPEDQISDEREATASLSNLLEDAIHRQLDPLPSEPVGVFLSGGLDSSITAALLVRAGIKVRAYTLDFGDYGFPEWRCAESVANYLSIPLVKVPADPPHIIRAISATAAALDVPYGDGVTAPLFLLGEAAKKDTSIVFNGEGGDQLFGGWTNKPLIASSVYGSCHPDGDDFRREYLRTFHRLYGYERSVYTDNILAATAGLLPGHWIDEAIDDSRTHTMLHRLRRANLMIKGAQNIQPRATDLASVHGLMVRTPFCDRELANWTFNISGDLWLRGACEKYLLKRAVEAWLPPDIVWRAKRGMGVPLTAWLLGPLWRNLRAWLRPASLKKEGCFRPDVAWRLAKGDFGAHVQGRRIGENLWLLLMWQAWKKAHLDTSVDFDLFGISSLWKEFRLRYHESV